MIKVEIVGPAVKRMLQGKTGVFEIAEQPCVFYRGRLVERGMIKVHAHAPGGAWTEGQVYEVDEERSFALRYGNLATAFEGLFLINPKAAVAGQRAA